MRRTNQITVAWVNIVDHPANLDPTARRISDGREPGGIYKTHRGFVVCLPDGKALAGYYGTVSAAQAAREKAGRA